LLWAFKVSKGFAPDEIPLTELLGTEKIIATVLIVNGDKALRKILLTLFTRATGFDACCEARNSVEAVKKTERLMPDLAVMDFPLPDTDGFDLAQKLKAIKPELPIFVLTADYSVKFEKKALSRGITAVFSKLDDLAALVANARAVCGLE
jgi:DNA-binding response OmpR family regulator